MTGQTIAGATRALRSPATPALAALMFHVHHHVVVALICVQSQRSHVSCLVSRSKSRVFVSVSVSVYRYGIGADRYRIPLTG